MTPHLTRTFILDTTLALLDTNWFSSINRLRLIDRLSSEQFELLVIGGGITGAGIALDAASRGMKVALVEKQDFASGTSSRSTKLIHGGLRYLKQLEFTLVAEVGRERAVLYNNAPHLVVPEKMLLPLTERGTYGSMTTSLGLWLYDWLALVDKDEKRRMLDKTETLDLEPLLRDDDLVGAGLYAEYRTDDARLTICVMRSAAEHGALPINYVDATRFLYEDQICGINCKDALSGAEFEIMAKQVVNAAGPWVDKVRGKDHEVTGKHLHLTKGVHIVVPKERFPIMESIYFDVEGGRMAFAIPRGKITYIGTTDTEYKGDYEDPDVTSADVTYLVEAVNTVFKDVDLREDDIISSWSGLRPLIHEDGKSPSELSRKDEVFVSDNGLISIAGGKLTGYRQMAKKVTTLVAQRLYGSSAVKCSTRHIKIAGGEFENPSDLPGYISKMADGLAAFQLSEYEANYLVRNYGRGTETILELMQNICHPDSQVQLGLAELQYCLDQEMVQTLEDFFSRRTGLMNFDPPRVSVLQNAILKRMAAHLGWTDQQIRDQEKALNRSTASRTRWRAQ